MWAAAAIACGNPSKPDVPERFYTLLARAGDMRTGPAGSVLAEPLTVLVTDSVGTPVRGVPVSFRVVGGRGALLLDSLLVSDAQGGASTQLRLGAEGDTAVVLAAFPGRDGGVRFVAVATAPATEIWGSEARLCNARPSAFSLSDNSPYFMAALQVILPAVGSTATSAGMSSSVTNSRESAMSLNECREPNTRTRGARAMTSCNSSIVAGRCILSARYS